MIFTVFIFYVMRFLHWLITYLKCRMIGRNRAKIAMMTRFCG